MRVDRDDAGMNMQVAEQGRRKGLIDRLEQMAEAEHADRSAGPRNLQRLGDGRFAADGIDDRSGAPPIGQVLDERDRIAGPAVDDMGRSGLHAERKAAFVPADKDDLPRFEQA